MKATMLFLKIGYVSVDWKDSGPNKGGTWIMLAINDGFGRLASYADRVYIYIYIYAQHLFFRPVSRQKRYLTITYANKKDVRPTEAK